MVFQAWRHQREPHQGFEDRLRHGIRALWFVSGQRRILCRRRPDLQSVSRLSLPSAWKWMGAFASADRALAVVSDGGQDRPPWPADVLEDQRRHVDMFAAIRERCARIMREGGAVPETS